MAADDDKPAVTASLPGGDGVRRRFRRAYALDRIFELMIGVGAAVGGLLYLVVPGRFGDSQVYLQLVDNFGATFAWAWDAAYGVGGLLLAVGIGLLNERVKSVGLALLCSTFAISFVSLVAEWDKAAHGTALQGALAVACGVRFHRLVFEGGAR